MFERLTLVLSCAMKFESYPHDTQICSMQIESRKLIFFLPIFCFTRDLIQTSFE